MLELGNRSQCFVLCCRIIHGSSSMRSNVITKDGRQESKTSNGIRIQSGESQGDYNHSTSEYIFSSVRSEKFSTRYYKMLYKTLLK